MRVLTYHGNDPKNAFHAARITCVRNVARVLLEVRLYCLSSIPCHRLSFFFGHRDQFCNGAFCRVASAAGTIADIDLCACADCVHAKRAAMEVESERIKVLVADAGPFIKGAPLQKWSSNVVTVREVIAEIKDKATRERLQVLPYELSFREPSIEAIQHGRISTSSCYGHKYYHVCILCLPTVTRFAKRTGDYGSLSPVDLKLVSLAYQLHCELEPAAQLRQDPPKEASHLSLWCFLLVEMYSGNFQDTLKYGHLDKHTHFPLSHTLFVYVTTPETRIPYPQGHSRGVSIREVPLYVHMMVALP